MANSNTLPLFPQFSEMNEEEKYNMISRFISCDSCTCQGYRPDDTSCSCGHDLYQHINQGQDLERRLKVATRLFELLEEKGKIDDYDYEDEDIASLKKQILFNAEDSTNELKRSRPDQHEEEFDEDEDEEEEDHDTKRNKTEETEDEDSVDEESEEEAESEESDDESEAEEDESEKEEEEEEKEEDETDNEANTKEEESDNEANAKEEESDNEISKEEESEESDNEIPEVVVAEDIDMNPLEIHQKDIKTESSLSSQQQEDEEEELVSELLIDQDIVMANGHLEEEEDEVSKVLKEFMPLEKRESPAMVEEREGAIKVQVVLNDGLRESMILLTGLKNIFQKQLPKMPKEYIARLVYDRNHHSIALIRPPNKVIGGICYRPFDQQEFAEIVFCAIASTEQVKGYGSFIMNHLKDFVSANTNVKHFLTYADNYAVGYFKKQGFTTEITLDKRKWVGYIKDYEGGTIMQCTIVSTIKYLQLQDILGLQRNAILKKIEEKSAEHIVWSGVRMPMGKNGKRAIDPLEVPGIKETGWTPEMDALSNKPRHSPHYNQMLHIVEEMQNYTHAWPFLEPVSIEDVADYYDIIKDPMDLATLEENVKADAYPTMEDFAKDTQKIFENCKIYNAEDTEYARCSQKLERFFNEKLRAANRAQQQQ